MNSGVLVLPSRTAPAAFSRATTVASAAGTKSRRPIVPQVDTVPAVSKQSLMVMGTPWSGPVDRPSASAASASRARSSASSASATTAFSFGLNRSMRSRYRRTSSSLERSPFLISSACAEVGRYGSVRGGLAMFVDSPVLECA